MSAAAARFAVIRSSPNEVRSVVLAATLGATFVAAISSKDRHFFGQFFYAWAPHAALYLLLFALRARPATITGASLAATVHLAVFWLWANTLPATGNGLIWLGYFFALPGGLCAAVLAKLLIDMKRPLLQASLLSFGTTLAGFALNQGLVCTTLLHCNG